MENIDPNEQNPFRKKLYRLDEPVDGNAWEKLNIRLEKEPKKRRRLFWLFLLFPVFIGLLWVYGGQDLGIRNQEIGNGNQETKRKASVPKVSKVREETSELGKVGLENRKQNPGNEEGKARRENLKSEADLLGKKPNSEMVNHEKNSDKTAHESKAEKRTVDIEIKNQTLVKSKIVKRKRKGILPLNNAKKEFQASENESFIASNKNGKQPETQRLNKKGAGKKVVLATSKSQIAILQNSVSGKVNNANSTPGNEQNESGLNFSKPIEPGKNDQDLNQTQQVVKTPEEKSDVVLQDLKPELPNKPNVQKDDSVKKVEVIASSKPDTLVLSDTTIKSETKSKNRIEFWTSAGGFGIFQNVKWAQVLPEYETRDLYQVKSISNSMGFEYAVSGKYRINSFLAIRLGLGGAYWKQSIAIVKIPGIYAPVYYEANGSNPNELVGKWTETTPESNERSQQWLMPWVNAQLECKPIHSFPIGARFGFQNSWIQGIRFNGEGQKSDGQYLPSLSFSLFYQSRKWELELKSTRFKQTQFGLAGRKDSEAKNIWLGLFLGYRF